MRRLAYFVFAGCVACESGGDARVILDLTALHTDAALSEANITDAHMYISGSGLEPRIEKLQGNEFNFIVSAGPDRTFVVVVRGTVAQTLNTGSDEPDLSMPAEDVPIYVGGTTVPLMPRTTVDLDIEVFRAGRLTGIVRAADGTPAPENTAIVIRRADTEWTRELLTDGNGKFQAPLPIGDYSAQVRFTAAGALQLAVAEFTVAWGKTTELIVDTEIVIECTDEDGDGACSIVDCDDWVTTGAKCSTGCSTGYLDADGDGLGDTGSERLICGAAETWVTASGDCDDSDASVITREWYQDNDGDGYGDPTVAPVNACDAPGPGYAHATDDCDDTDDEVTPFDLDGDGFSLCSEIPDCDETQAAVFPGADEICDGLDNDCSGTFDDNGDSDGDDFHDCVDSCPLMPNPSELWPTPVAIGFEWLALDCATVAGALGAETYTFLVNGTALGDPVNDSNAALCAAGTTVPHKKTFDVPAAIWSVDPTPQIGFTRTNTGKESLAWVKARLVFEDGSELATCLYDETGGDCDDLSIQFAGACDDCPEEFSVSLGMPPQTDTDSDGVGDECDPAPEDSTVSAAAEICGNNEDDDADGMTDESCCDSDVDSDGYQDCETSDSLWDCDDSSPAVNPGIDEIGSACTDGLDNDCDGATDADDTDCTAVTCTARLDLGVLTVASVGDQTNVEQPLESLKNGSASSASDLCPSAQGKIAFYEVALKDSAGVGDHLMACNTSAVAVIIWEIADNCGGGTCLGEVPADSCTEFAANGNETIVFGVHVIEPNVEIGSLTFSLEYEAADPVEASGPIGPIAVDLCTSGADSDNDGIADCTDPCIDVDADGACADEDCDDSDANKFPGKIETCDYADNDCDGTIDEGALGSAVTGLWHGFESTSNIWDIDYSEDGSGWHPARAANYGPGSVSLDANKSLWAGTSGNNGRSSYQRTSISSPFIKNLPAVGSDLQLVFRSYTYNEGGCDKDIESIEISTDLGLTWQTITSCTASGALWADHDGEVREMAFDMSAFLLPAAATSTLDGGSSVGWLQLRFTFDTVDDANSASSDDGWYIDNVRVYSCGN